MSRNHQVICVFLLSSKDSYVCRGCGGGEKCLGIYQGRMLVKGNCSCASGVI